jgi:hypothetical protein
MLDWVLKLADFEPSFWQLHHVQLADLRASPSWSYYMGLFQAHESELTTILLTNPGLLWETFDVLQVWTPGIVAADAGQGDTIIITQAQAGEVEDLLKDIAEAASPQLKEAIKYETQILDFPSQGGKNMNQALEKLKSRVKGQIYLPSILKN